MSAALGSTSSCSQAPVSLEALSVLLPPPPGLMVHWGTWVLLAAPAGWGAHLEALGTAEQCVWELGELSAAKHSDQHLLRAPEHPALLSKLPCVCTPTKQPELWVTCPVCHKPPLPCEGNKRHFEDPHAISLLSKPYSCRDLFLGMIYFFQERFVLVYLEKLSVQLQELQEKWSGRTCFTYSWFRFYGFSPDLWMKWNATANDS